ncbi:MAG: hypothetical protein HZC52_03570 [Planctomycetes bacterium]|uniref:hypothetical protein n=1 Tax=Candidatus Wunengus sp. YC65 TaxID=3367701 RepID=UPI001D2E1190|nr:hypothetical protein [Planctomycetota bacterium]
MAESLTPSDKDIVKEVENCVQEARALISQNNFEEAARRYERASKNLENIAEEKERTIKYKAFSHYLRGRSMVVEEILWRYREAKTEEAIGEFDKAESLYREIGNNVGTLVAEGWKEYMLGQKNELREDYTEATHFFQKSRETFSDLSKMLELDPEMVKDVKNYQLGAERAALEAEINELISTGKEEAVAKARNLTKDLKRIVPPEDVPFYEANFCMIQALDFFKRGVFLADRWDTEAINYFQKMIRCLDEAEEHAFKIQNPQRRSDMTLLLQGWNHVAQAGQLYAKALRSLFEEGDPCKARIEMSKAAKMYIETQDLWGRAGVEAVESAVFLNDLIHQRSKALVEACSLTKLGIPTGKWFLLFFVSILLIMVSLKHYLGIDFPAKMIIWTPIVVALIGAFGLQATKFIELLKLAK